MSAKMKPVIFTGPSVPAIMEGRKTQTRRLIKPQPAGYGPEIESDGVTWAWNRLGDTSFDERIRSRFAVGDQIWVREAFYCDHIDYPNAPEAEMRELLYYRAESGIEGAGRHRHNCWTGFSGETCRVTWRSPIHMPRWASRLSIEITEVRAQRLQEISEEDAAAEGFGEIDTPGGQSWGASRFIAAFLALNNLPENADPWVWAYTFRRIGNLPDAECRRVPNDR